MVNTAPSRKLFRFIYPLNVTHPEARLPSFLIFKLYTMRKLSYLFLVLSLAGITTISCKNKQKESAPATQTTPADTSVNTTAPVQISPDETLTKGLQDATKDYPGVTATVNDGEVTLTGNIKRESLPKLMQSIHALNPKKVNNNLTIQ